MGKMGASLQTKEIGTDLTEGSIMKLLLAFSLPIVISGTIQQLYSLADLVIVGQCMGSSGMAGVSIGGEMSDMVTPVATAFATAGQIYIAQLSGAKMTEKLPAAMKTLLSMMLLMALFFMAGSIFFHGQILDLLNCPENAFLQAKRYLLITAAGFPFIFGYNAICGILRGMGESRAPMFFVVTAAAINIILDLIFVAGLQWETAGAAIATVIAQAGSCAVSFLYLYLHRRQISVNMRFFPLRICGKDAIVILKIGIPQAMRSVLIRFSLIWVNASVNSYGLVVATTNGIGNKLQKLLDVFSTSLQQAAAAMIAQNLGAGKQKRAGKVVWCTLAVSLGISILLMSATLIFPRAIFRIFTEEEEVLEMGVRYLRLTAVHFLFAAVVCSFQAMIVGCGNVGMNIMIGFLDGVICRVGLCLLFAVFLKMGADGYFLGTAWTRALPAAACIAYFVSGQWKKKKLLEGH